jgi:hypothetical protein
MTRRVSLITAAILIILILGIGAYLMTRSPKNNQLVTSTQSTPAPTGQAVQAEKSTLKDLINKKQDVTCEIKYPEQQSEGTIYVSYPKFRGDFTITVNNQNTDNHLVSDGSYMYIWTEGSNKGTKLKLDLEAATASAQTTTGGPEAADLNKEVELKCQPWTVDQTKLRIPTEIEFTDLSSLVRPPTRPGASAPTLDQSVCNSITDPTAKAACIKALGG